MRYDVSLYELLSVSNDVIVGLGRDLEALKARLKEAQKHSSNDKESELLQDKIGEVYLTISYATNLRNEIGMNLDAVRLLGSLCGDSIDVEMFNLQYEDFFGDAYDR